MIAHLKFWCTRCGFKTEQTQRGQVGRTKNPAWDAWFARPDGPRPPEFLYDTGLPWRCDRCHTVTARSAHQASMGERIEVRPRHARRVDSPMTTTLQPTARQKALDTGITLAAMLLDRSGSMAGEPSVQLLEGAADFLEEMRDLTTPVSIAFDLFSSHRAISKGTFQRAQDAPYLTEERYRIEGSTAIYDAIHECVAHVEAHKRVQDRAIVSIFTDGQENASRLHDTTDTRALILRKQAEGWIFLFAGPKSKFASEIGIKTEHQMALKGGDIRGVLAAVAQTVARLLLPPVGGTIHL